jgi:hypothetical protein
MFLCACASGGQMMSAGCFYDIPVGATKEEVISQAGSPSCVRNLGDGCEEIEYRARMRAGARILQERRYIITLKNGKVVSKRTEQNSSSPLQFDSYEMQTTHNF